METASHKSYIKWTDEEWHQVAARAKALKQTSPEVPWMTLILACQDCLPDNRKRYNGWQKLSSLKPLFDILDLDEEGNVKPPPPPPPAPEPPPVPVLAASSAIPLVPVLLPGTPVSVSVAEAPTEILLAELAKRGSELKQQAVALTAIGADIKADLAANEVKLDTALNRVDAVEKMVLESFERLDAAFARVGDIEVRTQKWLSYAESAKTEHTSIVKLFDKVIVLFESAAPKTKAEATAIFANDMLADVKKAEAAPHPPPPEPVVRQRIAPIRFLLFGPFDKDIAHIQQRLPRSLNVELIRGENHNQYRFPGSIHYCLISGHADYTRRFLSAREFYGTERVIRMSNGSDGTFAHQIEKLASEHGKTAPAGNGN